MAAGTIPLPNATIDVDSDDDEDDDDDVPHPAPNNTSDETTTPEEPALPPAKLRLIAFGTSERIYEREDPRNQIIFLRSTCVDHKGTTQPFATPVGWCARQFIEPRSEVLDFVLHRSGERDAHMPVSDWDGGSGHGRLRSGWGDEADD